MKNAEHICDNCIYKITNDYVYQALSFISNVITGRVPTFIETLFNQIFE